MLSSPMILKPLTNTIDEQFLMQYRPPTIDEAVESIMRCVLKETRVQQLAWFKVHYGDEFADQVKRIVQAKWKKTK